MMNWKAYEYYKTMPEEQKPLYNGYSIERIEGNLNPNMADAHKEQYMKNVREVIEWQVSGVNLERIDYLKNSNFFITLFYMQTEQP
jgi:hypothetical protein